MLLDTDMFSEVLRGVNPGVVAQAVAYRAVVGYYTLSVITMMEMISGWHKMHREDRIRLLMAGITTEEVLGFDMHTADLAGRIYADLARRGLPIGWVDTMIAATAVQHNLPLVTGNTLHYQRIQALGYSLSVANWRN